VYYFIPQFIFIFSGVTSSCGMRVLQIFYKCLDQVVFSQHFSEKAALFSCNFTDFIAARLETEHSIICDRGGCVSLHILDDCGKFMNHTLSWFVYWLCFLL